MSTSRKLVPLWARGVTLALALANLSYGIIGYLKPSSIFQALDISNSAVLDAIFQFSARNTAIGIALSS